MKSDFSRKIRLENVGLTDIRLECLNMEADFHANTQKALNISHDTFELNI